MRKLLLALTLVGFAVNASAARKALYRGEEVVAGEVLVTFDERVHASEIEQIAASVGLEVARIRLENGAALSIQQYVARSAALRPTRMVVLRFDDAIEAMEDVLERLRRDPDVKSAGPNYIVWATVNPTDPKWGQQWGPVNIKAPAAWDVTKGKASVLVAVVDTGVRYTHEDLNHNYRGDIDKDFIASPPDLDAMDDNGHGTHCAGVIGANMSNGKGIAGLAPNTSIVGVKVLDSSGSGTFEQVAAGIDYAHFEAHANIISMSLGAAASACTDPQEPGACDSTKAAVDAAWADGVFVACATGNDGGAVGVPAAWESCTAVGATTSSNTRASFSNFGPELKAHGLVAPGVNIISAYGSSNTAYSSLSGTSMATPHVAGVAALVFATSATGTTGTAVRTKLLATAQDLGSAGADNTYGAGLVRADLAVAP